MTWTHVLIFWLVVAVVVLSAKNVWLRFALSAARDWQYKAMLAIARSITQPGKGSEDDGLLDSEVIE